MEKVDSRRWFKVIVEYEQPLVHILRAAGLDEVDEYFMQQMFDYEVYLLNWLAISKLTGCIIPSTMNGSAMAKGDLMFRRDTELYMLTSIDELGD